jgi:signal transduction histidine kinase
MYLGGCCFFGIGEFFQRLSATPQGALFWAQFSAIGLVLIPVGLYFFAANYTGRLRRRSIMIPLFLLTAGVVAFFNANGDIIFKTSLKSIVLYPWGFNNPIGQAFIFQIAWVLVLYALSISMLTKFYLKTHEQLLKRQVLIYIVAAMVPILSSLVTDITLPLLGHNVLPTGVAAETITSLLIFYGIRRYRLLTINQELLAQNILATMQEAVVVTRTDYHVELVNPEAERLLGADIKQLHNHLFSEFFEPESWHQLIDAKATPVSEANKLGSFTLVSIGNLKTPVRVFKAKLEETESLSAYIFVVSDITEVASSYSELENRNKKITQLLDQSLGLQEQLATEKRGVEHIVEVRTKELVVAQEQLKQADKLKTEFIILGSHNLRTPIATLLAGLEMISSTSLTSEQRETIIALGSSARRLQRFTEDMLAISQLEAGDQLTLQPASIKEVLDPLIAEVKGLTYSKTIKFFVSIDDPEAAISCNLIRLQNGLRSLIDNAFKFTKDGSVTIRSKRLANKVSISITDTGTGIEPSELPKLFTKFHRGTDSLRYEYEGEGIGLYLTKLIIDEHKGQIEVESKPGKGSTFTVTLPLIQS